MQITHITHLRYSLVDNAAGHIGVVVLTAFLCNLDLPFTCFTRRGKLLNLPQHWSLLP